ncbi:unnamed protein product [Lactuca saligna]|uniref:SBP-type domain-containing protein n=1 Tax=Lactuca saligna TaxID=75948 RepID=A0AA35Z4C8_LACSI|nr:unnamed protein product [Lactuca saligna]
MEWNWEIEMPKSLAISSHENDDHHYSFSGLVEEGAVISGEALIGLKLGRASSCSPVVKRTRGSYQSSHLARCQVEGCNLNLASAKDYHRRHRICSDHSKSPKVVVAGMERRFCQQCSRLHDLSEFDERKRSCRRRLSAHNARRRRPQSEDTSFNSTNRRAHMSFLVNRGSTPSPNSTPQSSSNFIGRGLDVIPNGTLSDRSSFHGVMHRNVNHEGLESNSNMIYTMEAQHAYSLQTTTSWGFNGPGEPSSFDQFIHGNNIDLTQTEMPLELQNSCNDQIPHHNFDYFSSD